MKAFEQQGNEWLKYWSDNQKSLFQAWAEGKPSPFAMQGEPPPGTEVMGELMQRSMQEWSTLAKNAWSGAGKLDPEAMKKLFDPAEWKRVASHFDTGLEKLTEGPAYATLWDLDKKMLNAQKLWVERGRDVEKYWELVQGAWSRAFELFTREIGDAKAAPIKSGRQMLDLWLETANKSLVEMHRSKAFLEAQRRMTRSSTEYRLAEREIAEAFCEMHHIPTRTEMDEMQHIVTELRREMRAMRVRETKPAARKQGAKRAAPKPTTAKRKRK